MTETSDTPRTDGMIARHTYETQMLPMNPPREAMLNHAQRQAIELVTLARQLERELAAARKDAERWRNIRTLDRSSVMQMVIEEGPLFRATDRDAYIDKCAAMSPPAAKGE